MPILKRQRVANRSSLLADQAFGPCGSLIRHDAKNIGLPRHPSAEKRSAPAEQAKRQREASGGPKSSR